MDDILKRVDPEMSLSSPRRLFALLAYLAAFCTSVSFSEATEQQIVLWNRNFDTAPVDKVLQLALDKTQDLFGPFWVVKSKPMEQGEALDSLERGSDSLDVLSVASSIDTDGRFIPIPIPVLKGLLGYRVCLIRKAEQYKFSSIETGFDFSKRNLSFCLGEKWPDVEVLERNGLLVKTSNQYEDLFDYLEKGVCDCFLRGAQEIIPEYEKHKDTVSIEKNILIHYVQPGFFYVNSSRPKLAMRIELGLLRAIDDGSFEQLVSTLTDPSISRLKLEERKKIVLNNPGMSPVSHKAQKAKSLWFGL